jgi:hypothetical protein
MSKKKEINPVVPIVAGVGLLGILWYIMGRKESIDYNNPSSDHYTGTGYDSDDDDFVGNHTQYSTTPCAKPTAGNNWGMVPAFTIRDRS